MPLFALIGHDVENSSTARKAARPAHVARLKALLDDNRLVIAGPCPNTHGEQSMTGSVVIADFADEQAVHNWLKDEPYLLEGVYSHVDVKPFIQALPTPNTDG